MPAAQLLGFLHWPFPTQFHPRLNSHPFVRLRHHQSTHPLPQRPCHLRHRPPLLVQSKRLGRSLALQNSREIVTGGIQCIGAGPLVQLSPRDQVRREIRRVALSISRIGAKMVLLQIGETMVIRIRARKSGIRE